MEDKSPRLDERLLQAYQHTDYHVDVPPLPLRIGRRHPELDTWLTGIDQRTWVFVTAWNPHSQPLPVAENERRQAELLRWVEQRDLPYSTGRSIADSGDWPPEESLLIAGLSRPEAKALGRRFEQNAVVYGEVGGVAELVITVDGGR